MPPSTRRPGSRVAQHGDIADAVLQADDDDIGRRMPCDDIGHLGGIGALDRYQHHAGIAKNRRIFRQRRAGSPQSSGRSLQSSSAAGRWPRFRRSRAAAPAARRCGRPPPTCRRQSSRCCRRRRCRSVGPNSFRSTHLALLQGFDSRTYRSAPIERRGTRRAAAPCNRHGPPLCFAAGLARRRRRQWVYSTYSTACRTARAARAPRARNRIAAAECRR